MPMAKGFLLDIVRAAMDQKEKAMGTDCLVLNLPILQGRRRKQNRMRPSCTSSTKESPTCLHGKSACRKVRAALYSPISGPWQSRESRPNPLLEPRVSFWSKRSTQDNSFEPGGRGRYC